MKKNKPLDIKMIRIDDILSPAMNDGTLAHIACIKIDVEGYEIGVISSMKHLLRHTQPKTNKGTVRNLLIELAPSRWEGLPNGGIKRQEAADIICDILWDAGFQKVKAFGNDDNKDIIFHNRESLHNYVTNGEIIGGVSQDFEFKRTKTIQIDIE